VYVCVCVRVYVYVCVCMCVCVCAALGIQHAIRMHHIVNCDHSGCAVIFHINS